MSHVRRSKPSTHHAAAKHHAPAPGRGKGRSAHHTGHSTRDTFQGSHAGRTRGTAAHSSGQVSTWIAQAQQILAAHGVPASKMNASDIAVIIQHESGGNPDAQNNWDSNARAGHPSIGLMQTIQSTFNAHKLPGHDNIRNPVDNIIAGVRYAIDRYGSVSNVPGVVDVHHGRKYVGY